MIMISVLEFSFCVGRGLKRGGLLVAEDQRQESHSYIDAKLGLSEVGSTGVRVHLNTAGAYWVGQGRADEWVCVVQCSVVVLAM